MSLPSVRLISPQTQSKLQVDENLCQIGMSDPLHEVSYALKLDCFFNFDKLCFYSKPFTWLAECIGEEIIRYLKPFRDIQHSSITQNPTRFAVCFNTLIWNSRKSLRIHRTLKSLITFLLIPSKLIKLLNELF